MSYIPQIRTKHPSQDHLRGALNRQPNRCVVRLGSTTTLEEIYPTSNFTNSQRSNVIEVNTVEAVKNSASKLRMKECFTRGNVRTAEWISGTNNNTNGILNWANDRYPIVAKSHYGSRGEGNYKLNNREELEAWMRGKTLSNYIFEKFHNYSREYRIHVTAEGYFYTCRKMLRQDADRSRSWQRHDDNCVWIIEENPSFDKPVNWNTIVEHCVRALNATGLDIAGFDVKVQSATDSRGRRRENPEFIIIESNSACSHGTITAVKYKEALNRILDIKNNRINGRRELHTSTQNTQNTTQNSSGISTGNTNNTTRTRRIIRKPFRRT